MMTVQPDQADAKCKHSNMTCMDYVQPQLYVDGIDAIIDTKILKRPHILLVCLAYFYNERKLDIGTPKKERGYFFQNAARKDLKQNSYLCQ